jgi:hypothetical protein
VTSGPSHPFCWHRLWAAWKRLAHAIGTVQARLILSVLYFVLLPPFALVRRLGADPLGRRPAPGPTSWRPRPPEAPTLDAARRQ